MSAFGGSHPDNRERDVDNPVADAGGGRFLEDYYLLDGGRWAREVVRAGWSRRPTQHLRHNRR